MYAVSALWIFKLKGNFVIIMLVTLTSHSNVICALMCTNLNNHRNHCAKHYKDPVVCPECHKVFPLKSSLSNHMRVHTGVKDVCSKEDCGKSFSSRGKYLEHMQYAHLDEKTVQCHMCSDFFQTPSNLHYHLSSVHYIFPRGLSPRNKT